MLLAVGLMLVSSIVVVLDAVLVRYLAVDIHPFEILFFRNLFAMLALMPFLARKDLGVSLANVWSVHGVRASLKLAALGSSFFAITLLPLSVVTAIAFTTPLFASLGSMLFLGERWRWVRVAALVIGFIGVLVVLRPTEVPVGIGAILALGSALTLAAVVVLLKYSSSREGTSRIVWLNLAISVPLAAILCLPFWTMPSLLALGLMAIQGVGGLISQLAVARAFRLADASLLVPIEFVRLPMAVALGYVLFAEQVEWAVLLGGAIILAAIILLFAKGRQNAMPPSTP